MKTVFKLDEYTLEITNDDYDHLRYADLNVISSGGDTLASVSVDVVELKGVISTFVELYKESKEIGR